ncbi:sigma-70 family RNA polymerase sigma factor [Candidatus Poribacteria bacterium]|jgi:RNA polymerase sigma-70 factor, ECF subfamily|nr:sigma-70 family RNA polymerase sigma factor [Candidatus Poribacteria bacterium]MBT5533821.1 sigma-70 family RNA polymerase sigma factor [Candidatus Poribacteria bacterium]MBT5710141.1 sigma-70 family RNA polymerase sigma factor [Candidatus Poribacteria bacterium]MBT7805705.1 sigma-70 family RNA polymerase sigma factor [Candidatus Poribacteria bacterium]
MADDATMVAAALGGDPRGFSALVRTHQPLAYATAYAVLRNPEEAQEVAQDAFVTAYEKLESLERPERFASWLRTIALNAAKMRRRASARARLVPLDDIDESAPMHGVARPERPDVAAERKEIVDAVREALVSLPGNYRVAATLFFVDDLSYGEISDSLSVPVSTVQSRLQRARGMLRERIRRMVEKLAKIRNVAMFPNPLVAGKTVKVTLEVEEPDTVQSAVVYDPRGERLSFSRVDDTAEFALEETVPFDAAPGAYYGTVVVTDSAGAVERKSVELRVT